MNGLIMTAIKTSYASVRGKRAQLQSDKKKNHNKRFISTLPKQSVCLT